TLSFSFGHIFATLRVSNFNDIVPLGPIFALGYPIRVPGAQQRNPLKTLYRRHFRKEIDTHVRAQEDAVDAASMGADEAISFFAAELGEGTKRSASRPPRLPAPVRTKIGLIGCSDRSVRPPAGIELQHDHARPDTGQGFPDPEIHAIHVQGQEVNVAGKAA